MPERREEDALALNALISIRPTDNLTPLEYAELVDKTWKRLGVWSRQHTDNRTFHCILVREASTNGKRFGVGEHFHALVHISPGRFNALKAAVARWHPAPGEALVEPADQHVRHENGKIRSVIGYVTKQRSPQAWYMSNFSRKPGGIVLGKRFKISANLRARHITISDTNVVLRFAVKGP